MCGILDKVSINKQELDREKAARLDQETAARLQAPVIPEQIPLTRHKSAAFENGLDRKLSSASSLSSMEESYFLQTTLDSSENLSERRSLGEGAVSPYYMKNMTSSTYEAALRQKEGEFASYMSRLASMDSIRDSLAEELVKMTAQHSLNDFFFYDMRPSVVSMNILNIVQCEKLGAEAATLPGIRAELEALRRRHSAALELMGERDEELEELRADIVDLKEMYREQVNLLVNKIQRLSSPVGAAW
ncbi:Golgin candidate 5 [Orobanche gracilis]